MGRLSPLSTPHSLSTSSLTFGAGLAAAPLATSWSSSCLPVSQLVWPAAEQSYQNVSLQKEVLRLRRELDAAEATAQSALKLTRISEQDLEEERHALQEVEIQAQNARETASEAASQLKVAQQRALQAEQRIHELQQELQQVKASFASRPQETGKIAGLQEDVSLLRRQLEASRKKEAFTADAAAKQRSQLDNDLQQAWATIEDMQAQLQSTQSRHADDLHRLRSANSADQTGRESALRSELEHERYQAQQAEAQWASDKQHMQASMQELRAEIQAMRSRQNDSQGLERMVDELRGQLSRVEDERDRAKDELSRLIEDFTTVQSDAKHWQDRSISLEQELAELRWQHDSSTRAVAGPTAKGIEEPVIGTSGSLVQMPMTRAVSENRRESEVFDIYSEVTPADLQALRQTMSSHPDFGYQRRMSPSISDDVFAVNVLDADDVGSASALQRRQSGSVVASVRSSVASQDLDLPRHTVGFPTFDAPSAFEVEEADVQYRPKARFEADLLDEDHEDTGPRVPQRLARSGLMPNSTSYRTSGSYDDDDAVRMP